jgi:hypothetical protein
LEVNGYDSATSFKACVVEDVKTTVYSSSGASKKFRVVFRASVT